jgi:hypothetical protein
MNRSEERLGESDAGLIFYRKMLEDQMRLIEDGKEPINVLRDAAQNVLIHNDQEGWSRLGHNADMDEIARYGSQLGESMREIITKSANVSGLTA